MMVIAAMALLLCGCGKRADTGGSISMDQYAPTDVGAPDEEDGADETYMTDNASDTQIYVIIHLDKKNKLIGLGLPDSLRTVQYGYTQATQILDEHGQYVSLDRLKPGNIVTVGELDSEAKLTSIRLASQVWYQDNITRFSIDQSIGMLVIGETKYRYDQYLRVFSDDQEISISQIGENDVIRVQGQDKQILSIQVVQGHGTIVLSNTELFEGGWISLGTKIYAKVTPDMTLEVPEGRYELSVANDGYGDTKIVQVKRSETTMVDLDEYKGEGPKMCQVTFAVHVPDALLYINGDEINYGKPVELRYGVYQLTVIADGYETWERQLVIHSEEAVIDIGEPQLSDDGNGTDTADEGDTSSQGSDTQDSQAASESDTSQTDGMSHITGDTTTNTTNTTDTTGTTGTGSGSDSLISGSGTSSTGDSYSDYLDTIGDLIKSLADSQN